MGDVASGAPSVIHRDPSFPVRLFLNFVGGSLDRASDLLAGMFDLVAGPFYGLVDFFARSLCRLLSFTGPDSEPQSDGQQQDGQFSRCFHDPLPKSWIFGLYMGKAGSTDPALSLLVNHTVVSSKSNRRLRRTL